MLKKSLLAIAVSAVVAGPAMAVTVSVQDSKGNIGNNFRANTLAVQTKQSVLDRTTLDAKVSATFNNTVADANDELKGGGEIVYALNGEAQFNLEKVADLLSSNTGSFPGITVTVASDVAGRQNASLSSVAQLGELFQIDTTGGGTSTVRYILDQGNKRLSLRLKETINSTVDLAEVPADGDKPAIPAQTINLSDAYITVSVDFNAEPMKQGFKLTSGSRSTVSMSVGALQNASFTGNPVATPVLFKTDDLFTLKQVELTDKQDKTALVAHTYKKWNGANKAGLRAVTLHNNSTLQNIQTGELRLSLMGDFSGITLLDDADKAVKWSQSEGLATVIYNQLTTDVTIPGNQNAGDAYTGYPLVLPNFVVAENNDKPLEAQNFKLKAEITANSFTYEPYAHEIGNVFVIVRDGMKFDTVTTGTSAQNVIYIRDVSKVLPTEGGKIFVTITEYDKHELENGGKGTELVTRAVLPTRLPSNGAVTLTPAGIADALGVASTPGRQARFFFEVETNQGEAAVKKQTSEGVDIQTGAQGTVPVDFTL